MSALVNGFHSNKANERLSRYSKRCLNEQDEALFKKRFTTKWSREELHLIDFLTRGKRENCSLTSQSRHKPFMRTVCPKLFKYIISSIEYTLGRCLFPKGPSPFLAELQARHEAP